MSEIANAAGGAAVTKNKVTITEIISICMAPVYADDLSKAAGCPICYGTDLVWAYRYDQPNFRFGALACRDCGAVYDVTPRASECRVETSILPAVQNNR